MCIRDSLPNGRSSCAGSPSASRSTRAAPVPVSYTHLHITDLSWGRVNHPEEIVSLDEKIRVVILDFDDAKKRIALGLKQLAPHPWEALDPNLKVGDHVKGKVVVMADYGAFVEIAPGVEGLIHVSETVSYTHLDVYKRQGAGRAAVSGG